MCFSLCTCSVVVMEGDPHPGAIVGRMSFQSFNPSIDVSIKAEWPENFDSLLTMVLTFRHCLGRNWMKHQQTLTSQRPLPHVLAVKLEEMLWGTWLAFLNLYGNLQNFISILGKIICALGFRLANTWRFWIFFWIFFLHDGFSIYRNIA